MMITYSVMTLIPWGVIKNCMITLNTKISIVNLADNLIVCHSVLAVMIGNVYCAVKHVHILVQQLQYISPHFAASVI